MSSWQLTGWSNVIISLAYLSIATIIVRGLIRTRQFGTNRLALGTAAIFLTCGVAHGHHALDLLGGGSSGEVAGMRMMIGDWYGVAFDASTAAVAVTYLAMRRSYGVLLRSPAMFDQSSDAHYRQLVANLPHARVLMLDRDARVVLGAGGATGKAAERAAATEGQLLWNAIPAAATAVLAGPVAEALAGRPSDFEYVSPVDGDHLHARSRPMRDGAGEINGALLVFEDVSIERALQTELSAAAAFNDAVRDASPDITTITDLGTGAVTWSSRSMWETFGWDTPDRVQAHDEVAFDTAVADEDIAAVVAANRSVAALADGTTHTVRYRVRGCNGQRWVSRRTTPFNRSECGTVSQGLSVVRDVSDVVAAEASTAQLAAIVKSSNDAIFTTTPDGTVLSWNSAAEQLYGYSGDEMIGRNAATVLVAPVAQAEHLASPDRLALGDGRRELTAVRGDGRQITVSATGSPIVDDQGRVIAVSNISRDITQQKQAELALAASEERMRLILINAPIGLAVVDLDGRWLQVNPALCEITGRSDAELLELTVDDVCHPDDQGDRQRMLRELLSGHLPSRQWETRCLHADGHVGWVLVSLALVRADDEPQHFVVQVLDITARKRDQDALEGAATQLRDLNDELARSNTELEQFAYVASHDLQEPLRHISAFAQKFADRYSGITDERGDRYIGYVVDGSKRLQQLIAGLLEFSRVERSALHRELVDLDGVVTAAIRGVSISAGEAHAVLDACPLPVVFGDRDLLYRLFVNLLSNAIKFARPDQPACVQISSAMNADGRTDVLVADNGIGIAPEYRDRVFEIFERLNGHDYPGTGIGLSVARRIADAHGATITFDQSPAGGALVTVTFPTPGTTALGAPNE